MKSFVGGIISPGQTAEALADAGFFYVGKNSSYLPLYLILLLIL